MKNNILINIFFATGDATCEYWTENRILHDFESETMLPISKERTDEIKKALEKAMEQNEDSDYTEITDLAFKSLNCKAKHFAFCKHNDVTYILNIFI